jgi:hypothetical protein
MCFSASASFGAGIVLAVIGIASLKKISHPSQSAFAAIPLLFSVQQFCEGFLWMALTNPQLGGLESPMTYIFLFFAQVVWPVWVPVSIFMLSTINRHKSIQRGLIVTGSVVSIYLGYCLLVYDVRADVIGYHIAYSQDYPPLFSRPAGLLYIIATIAPPFISSRRRIWMLGVAVLISYLITSVFYQDYIVSVWCFFASIISITILYAMQSLHTEGENTIQPATISGKT